MTIFKKFILSIFVLALVAAVAAGSYAWYWATSPVSLTGERVDFLVESGSRPRTIAKVMNDAGIRLNEDAFVIMARLSKRDTRIKAGAYEATRADTPWKLLERLANGDMTQTRLTLVEGWTYQRIRQARRDDPNVKQTLDGISDAVLLQRLGAQVSSPEGLFYPDTYVFVPGSADFDILRRAYHAQQQVLEAVWQERDPDTPLTSPYEALIMASIVEKETGDKADRKRVAGVFANRLRLNMPLQTDPTVIYGMGDLYDGRIRKKDLTTDTPWNTDTRTGLPPTPIANSGRAALEAAVNPEGHDYLYFVSRGDGTSEFSKNLGDHNRAVSKYILNRNP